VSFLNSVLGTEAKFSGTGGDRRVKLVDVY